MEYYVLFGERWEPRIHEMIKVRGKFYHALLFSLYHGIDLYRKEYLIEEKSGIYFKQEWVRLQFFIMNRDFVENNVDKLLRYIQNYQISELMNFLSDSAFEEEDQVYDIELEFERGDEDKVYINLTLTDGIYKVNLGGIKYTNVVSIIILFAPISLDQLLKIETLSDIEDFEIEKIAIPDPENEFVQYELGKGKLNVLLIDKFKDLKQFNSFEDMVSVLAPEGVPVEL